MAILETRELSKNFGALNVAQDINFSLAPGIRHALIGPNGAGKTTFVNLLTGALQPTAGRIVFGGHDITSLPQAKRVKLGITRTHQISNLFTALTVIENVTLSIAERLGVAWNMLRSARTFAAVMDEAMEILASLNIKSEADRLARELPYGQQRLVEIAIALGTRPKVLLLDEPAAGVPKGESDAILDVVGKLPGDVSVLIIEHDMDIVFRFAQRITLLVGGAVLVEGTPAEIAADRRVQEIYLGETLDA